jgi:hypothetical protein
MIKWAVIHSPRNAIEYLLPSDVLDIPRELEASEENIVHFNSWILIFKDLAINLNVFLNVGYSALPDLQATLALQNTC